MRLFSYCSITCAHQPAIRLAAKIGETYPLWTQWQLKTRVAAAGFTRCKLLGAVCREVGVLEGLLRFPAQELLGTWAVVAGVKPR